MELDKIDEMTSHKDLKEFTEYVTSLLLNDQISPEKAKSLCLLIKQQSIELDKAKTEKLTWDWVT